MVRGGTHRHNFYIPFDAAQIEKIFVSYSQNGEVVLEKSTDDCVFNSTKNCLQVDLSQEDTLSFSAPGIITTPERSLVIIQLRVLLANGHSYVSAPIKERLFDVLKGGQI